ncbi:MAG: tRNA (cytidine(34)-2'-O)-methyltransferase [Deltaproteobacteria bacterium]|nr:tRNA (cytidine(34)-2'-O)-methyltransferase [Deltaproteobacteria bacterium]
MLNLVLYHPQIPPNTGNIGRLCVGIKAKLHLIEPLGFAIDDATVKRAGLDYWQFLDLSLYPSWSAFEEAHPQANCHFYSKKVSRPYTQAQYHQGDYLVFGSETKGLPEDLLREKSSQAWTIPMWGPTRSLNLATSVGIVTYEALRQITKGFE